MRPCSKQTVSFFRGGKSVGITDTTVRFSGCIGAGLLQAPEVQFDEHLLGREAAEAHAGADGDLVADMHGAVAYACHGFDSYVRPSPLDSGKPAGQAAGALGSAGQQALAALVRLGVGLDQRRPPIPARVRLNPPRDCFRYFQINARLICHPLGLQPKDALAEA
jgi:hypothetical protein